MLAKFLMENECFDNVEFSSRCEGFKIKLENLNLTKSVSSALKKCTRSITTNFKGIRYTKRMRLLSVRLLDKSTAKRFQNYLETLESWCGDYLSDLSENMLYISIYMPTQRL